MYVQEHPDRVPMRFLAGRATAKVQASNLAGACLSIGFGKAVASALRYASEMARKLGDSFADVTAEASDASLAGALTANERADCEPEHGEEAAAIWRGSGAVGESGSGSAGGLRHGHARSNVGDG